MRRPTHVVRLGLLAVSAALAASCARDPEIAKQEYFESGNRYFAAEQFREAIIEYRNAVQIDARFGEARYKLAEAYVRVNDLVAAFREYVRAADLLPDNAEAQIKAGHFLLVARQFEDARSRAEKVLAADPKNVEAQILLGNALGGLREMDAAIAQIEEAIQLDPELSRAYTSLGVLHFIRGTRQEAEAAMRKAIAIDPQSIDARLALANYLWSVGRVAESETTLKEALTLDPRHLLANRALASFYLFSNRSAEAEQPLKAVADISGEPGARLLLADYYVTHERPADAKPILEKLAEEAPTYAAAHTRLAVIEYEAGRTAVAHGIVDDVLAREPANPPALVLKGRFLLTENKPDEALVRARAAATADPRWVPGHYLLGTIYAAKKDVDQAVKAFTEVLRLNPRAVDAQVQMARLHLDHGNVPASIQFAEQAVRNRPDHGMAHFLLARGLMTRGDLKVAEAEMRNLLASNPDAAPMHSQMGTLHVLKKDPASARRYFERALELDPNYVEALSGLVAMEVAAGRKREALARVEARVAAGRKDAVLLLLAARTYLTNGDQGKTEQALRAAIEVDPAQIEAYAMLGQLYLLQSKLDEARAEFEELAARQPNAVAAPTMVAMILELQGKPGEAQARYERIVQLDVRAAVAANNLAWLYTERGGNLDVALQLARTAKQHLPEAPEVNDTLGWVYYKKGMTSLAIPPLVQSVQKDPKNPLYHYHLGMAYQQAGDDARARRALEQALKLRPDFVGAADARTVLSAMQRLKVTSSS